MKTLIGAKTAAETSAPFDVKYSPARVACTIVAAGLTGEEEISVEIECLPGEYTSAYNRYDEEPYALKSTANILVIDAPGRYRLVKPVTYGYASVGMHEFVN